MVADLRYFNSLELEVDSLKSQLETQKTQFLNEIYRLSRKYYYVDHMNAILENQSKEFCKEREQYFESQDLKAQLQGKGIAIRVIPYTSVSKPQLQSNQMKNRVILNNSQGKKQEVEDHRRNVKFSNNKTSVTACNGSLNAKTSNVNFVCVTCGKCVLNDNHDNCVLHYLNGVNSRTKMPMAVPISTREPKHIVNQSVATPLGRTVASKSTNQKPRYTTRKQYKNVTRRDNPIHLRLWVLKTHDGVEKFLGTMKFGNDQIAPILSYGDLVQGLVTIKRVYYVEGLNHNLFSIGQFYDADLEVAFWKSTCYIRDLKGNDLLTATSSQALLWHRHLSHLNFDTINLLSKNDIVIGLPKLKFVKDHICSSCELRKAKRKSFQTKTTPSSKRRDGENLDKIKEKGDACIFVGYSTQSRAYRVFNKRTRVIVETIQVNFDELPQMASDHASSDPVPQCPITALEHNSLSPGPQSQENFPQAAGTVITSNELDLLFSPMFDELLNGSTQVVSKSSAVTTADAPNQCQQQHTTPSSTTTVATDTTPLNTHTTPEPTCQDPTQAPTVTSTENINQAETITENAQVENDEFINIFCTPVQDRGEPSSRHVDSSNMLRIRRQLESDGEMCLFALTVSRTEPKNIKEAMADSAWIESMQEELHKSDRLDVWELVDRLLCKNVINMKWLWKNKSDEENTVIRNKSHLVAKGYA
nr:hypothetical protein [Tanacetum cinerariifolium]